MIHFNLEKTKEEIASLEKKTENPDFYSDMESAGKILQTIKGLKGKIERFCALRSSHEDLLTLVLLGIEENDASVLPEIKEGVKTLEENLHNMELETLLSSTSFF